jgi:hypothetical protein
MKDDKMGYYGALYGNKYYVLPSVSYTYYEVVVCRLPKRYAHISMLQLYSVGITVVWLCVIRQVFNHLQRKDKFSITVKPLQ